MRSSVNVDRRKLYELCGVLISVRCDFSFYGQLSEFFQQRHEKYDLHLWRLHRTKMIFSVESPITVSNERSVQVSSRLSPASKLLTFLFCSKMAKIRYPPLEASQTGNSKFSRTTDYMVSRKSSIHVLVCYHVSEILAYFWSSQNGKRRFRLLRA